MREACYVEKVLRSVLLPDIESSVVLEDEAIRVTVQIPEGELEDVALILDGPLAHFDGWDWQEEIDGLDESDTYELSIEIATKVPETVGTRDEREHSVLSVYSKDADNHEGWPVAFVLAARLAHELGAIDAEEL